MVRIHELTHQKTEQPSLHIIHEVEGLGFVFITPNHKISLGAYRLRRKNIYLRENSSPAIFAGIPGMVVSHIRRDNLPFVYHLNTDGNFGPPVRSFALLPSQDNVSLLLRADERP